MKTHAMYQNHLEKLSRTRLDDVLLDEGIVERSEVADAQAEHEMTGRALSSVLLEREVIDEWDLAKLICIHYSLPFIDLTDVNTLVETEDMLPYEFCLQFCALPLDEFGTTFTLAVSEMPDPVLLDQIIEISGKTPFLYVAVRRQILEALEKQRNRSNKRSGASAPRSAAAARAPAVAKAARKPLIDASAGRAEIEEVFRSFEIGEASKPSAELIPVQGLPVVSMKLSASVVVRSRRNRVKEPVAVAASTPAPAPTPAPTPAPEAPAAKPSGWQSIFDIGDDAVGGNG